MDDNKYEEMFKVLLDNFSEEEAIQLIYSLSQEDLEKLVERLRKYGTKG